MRTEIFTYFTSPDGQTRLLYSAEDWIRLRLTLETAGPVAISNRQEIGDILAGNGILLVTGDEKDIILPRGERLYVAAQSIDRVSVVVEPIPYMAEILSTLQGRGGAPSRKPEAPPAPGEEQASRGEPVRRASLAPGVHEGVEVVGRNPPSRGPRTTPTLRPRKRRQ